MRFLAFHYLDLRDKKTWSGTPAAIIEGLEARGHEVVVLDPVQQAPLLSARLKFAFHKHVFKRIFHQSRDRRINRLRGREATAAAKKIGPYDAVVSIYLPELAYFETTRPIIAVQDATFKQLLDYYDSYARNALAKITIRDGIALDKEGITKTSHVIYPSKWAADSAIRDYAYPQNQISILPMGACVVDPPSRAEVEKFVGNRGGATCKFLFVGKEWERKGGEVAISILQELRNKGQPAELHVVGCRPAGPLPPFVQVHGFLSRNDARQAQLFHSLYADSDFFLLPTSAEAFGLVFAEAAAYGLPVVSTDTGGISSVVRESWGFLLPTQSPPAAYIDWILSTWRDRALYSRLALNARQDFETRLTWDVIVDEIVEVAHRLAPQT